MTEHFPTDNIETRPFDPFLPPQATVMMMGSFPPTAEKRSMNFHYPNFQNDMWRVYGSLFFNDPDHFRLGTEKRFDAEKIKAFLAEKGIASCPTVLKAIREKDNAADKYLKVVEAVNLSDVLAQLPECRYLLTTGGKATEVLLGMLPHKVKPPKTNEFTDFPFECEDGTLRRLQLHRLPSTSRAYPLSFAKKTEAYRAFFQHVGLL